MRWLGIDVPNECEVVGGLYESDDVLELSEDMLEVHLRSGVLLSAGWYPDGCKDGQYVVTASRGAEFVVPPFETRDINAAKDRIERLARVLNRSSERSGAVVTMRAITMVDPSFFVSRPPIGRIIIDQNVLTLRDCQSIASAAGGSELVIAGGVGLSLVK